MGKRSLALPLRSTASVRGLFSGTTQQRGFTRQLHFHIPSTLLTLCTFKFPFTRSIFLSLSLASSTADFLLTHSRQTWSITSSLTMKQDSEGFAWQREGGEEERAQRLPHRFSFSPVPVNRAAWYHSSASRVCFKKQNKYSRQSPLLAVWYRAKTFARTHSHTHTLTHIHAHSSFHAQSLCFWHFMKTYPFLLS